jgi:hypothetical protein
MKRHLLTLAVALVAGLFLTAGDAHACHKKKCRKSCEPRPCVVVCEPCPPPPSPPPSGEPCRPKKKCGRFSGGLCHKKKRECAPAPCATVAYVSHPAPQVYYYAAPSGQAIGSPQGAPTKQMPAG